MDEWPAPAITWAMLLIGFAAMGAMAYRRRNSGGASWREVCTNPTPRSARVGNAGQIDRGG
jgi:hypothetical protein